MRRTLAFTLSVGLLAGCFPHNEKYRTYAKVTEGSLIAGGILVELLANSHTGANCDQMAASGYDTSCHSNSAIYGGIGLGMIVAGLTGFIATVSTAEEAEAAAVKPEITKTAPGKGELKLPPGTQPPSETPADQASPTGSDAPSKPAP